MIGSLFSGIGGIELGLESCGLGPVAWQCDNDPHARAVLATHWPSVHRFSDVKEIGDEAPPVDIICGGFPCQDISLAGKGAGIDGARSGLWSEYARIVRALRPAVVFVENVAALVNRGLDRVLGDLAALGFDAEWDVFRASDVGAPHRRERLFLLAYADGERVRQIAEWGSRSREGERTPEREHSKPVHDRAALAYAVRCGLGSSERDVRAGESDTNGSGEGLADTDGPGRGSSSWGTVSGDSGGALPVGAAQLGRRGRALSDTDRAGREGLRSGEPSGPRRADAPELRAGDVADADRSRCGARARTKTRDQERNEHGHGGTLADPHGNGRESIGRSGLLNGERTASGHDPDRRHRAHRFPPGPAAIAGWNGPQPAIRRGDDGVPGRSHRLRLLGNSVVPQQAALAWRTLSARVADRRAA